MSINALEVKDLSVAYQSSEALSRVSFAAGGGDYVGIVGPNGSGKTTLIKTIVGLLPPLGGSIRILGEELTDFRQWHEIGYLPQKTSALDPRFPASVYEIVASGVLSTKRFPKVLSGVDKGKIQNALELLGIVDLRARLIGRLSGGQQQRVLLARALVNEPKLLLLDEPTVALDPQTRENFYVLLQKLNKDKKITILLVSHDTGTVGKYASKLLYLDKKVIFYGGFDEFCSSSSMTDYFGLSSQHLMCHRHE